MTLFQSKVMTRPFLLASAGMAIAFAAQPALAQASDDDRNAEIIVTARKKQESILNVPVVENVITAEALETHQINNLQDITTRIPGLVSGNAVLAIGEQMSLRGVGSNSLDQGVDQSVSLNIDGLQLTHGLAYRAASFDLQQVEVLKGPQALYFGKNSTAGVISFRSADPGDKMEIKGRAGYEIGAREKRAELILSTPLSDTLGLRVAGLYSDSKGIFVNKATPLAGTGALAPRYRRIGGGESWLVRTTLLWKPTDQFTARLKVNIARDNARQGGINQLAYCPDGTGALGSFPRFIHPDDNCKYDKTVYFVDMDPTKFPGIRNGGTPFLKLKQDFGTLELNYDLNPELALTSVTGLYKSHADTMINGTFQGYAAPTFYADNVFKRREFSQELRLESDYSSPINFSAGGFFQDGKVSNDFTLGGNGALSLPQYLQRGLSAFDIKSVSAFGQLRFAASDQFEVAGGARWQSEERNLDVINRLAGNAPVVLAPGSDKIKSKNWSPELTLTYKPSDTMTVFAALKQAYKSGSFNIVIPGATGQDKSFGDEKVRGGEVGLKSRLMDRALSFDVAAYYYRYSGLQTGVNEPAQNGLPVLRTVNAGKAKVYGVDLEAHYRPPSVDGLSLNLAAAWNKATFVELNNVPCYGGQLISQGCNQFLNTTTGRYTSQNLKGVPFVRAPEWIVNFGFDYEVPVGDNMRMVLANDNRFSAKYQSILGDPKVRPQTVQPKALTIDASLTLYGPEDRWSLSIAGKNLTDKLRPGYCSSYNSQGASIFFAPLAGVANASQLNASGSDEIGCSMAAARAISVTVGFKY